MLKIREDIDLKELEKFGFKKYEYIHLLMFKKDNHEFASINISDRKYEIWDLCNLTYNLTYDLIQAGLLTKEK